MPRRSPGEFARPSLIRPCHRRRATRQRIGALDEGRDPKRTVHVSHAIGGDLRIDPDRGDKQRARARPAHDRALDDIAGGVSAGDVRRPRVTQLERRHVVGPAREPDAGDRDAGLLVVDVEVDDHRGDGNLR